jgi:hypothetical protein
MGCWLLPLLSRNLELIAADVVRRALRAVLSVEITHIVTEPYAALHLILKHAIAMLYDRLAVGTLLQVRANLSHDVRVHCLY